MSTAKFVLKLQRSQPRQREQKCCPFNDARRFFDQREQGILRCPKETDLNRVFNREYGFADGGSRRRCLTRTRLATLNFSGRLFKRLAYRGIGRLAEPVSFFDRRSLLFFFLF